MPVDKLTIDRPMQHVTLTIKMPKSLPFRMWAAKGLFHLAARIIGCGVKVEIDPTPNQPKPRRRPF